MKRAISFLLNKVKKLTKSQRIAFYSILGVIALFFIWWFIAFLVNSSLFPTPIKVIPIFFSFFAKGSTYKAIGGTFLRILISFLISFIAGMLLGVLAGYFYRLEAFLKPLITFLRTLPTAAVVLVLIALIRPMWLPIIVTVLVMFPLFYQAFLDGIKNINENVKDELKMDGGSPFNSLFKVYIPVISPYILLAVVQSLGLGMKVSIMAEILGGSNQISGLGRLIHYYANVEVDIASTMALSLIAILIIVIIDICMNIVKKRINKESNKWKVKTSKH